MNNTIIQLVVGITRKVQPNFALRRPSIRKAYKSKRLEFTKKYVKSMNFWKKIL